MIEKSTLSFVGAVSGIGTLAEKSLHAALKAWYAQPGDALEVPVGGSVIDLVRGDLLIEIQTRHLYAMKRKLARLTGLGHPVRVVHPIALEKWIVRENAQGQHLSRRKSPKRGGPPDIFRELVRAPHLVGLPGLTLEIALIREEEIWRDDGQGSWRRKGWSLHDRRLLEVAGQLLFTVPADLLALLPEGLPRPFTNHDLQAALGCHPTLPPKITYTLRQMGLLAQAGLRGRAHLFEEA